MFFEYFKFIFFKFNIVRKVLVLIFFKKYGCLYIWCLIVCNNIVLYYKNL